MYTTANNGTTTEVQEYLDDAPQGIRADMLLQDAERVVKSVAPPPDPFSSDYQTTAKSAEYRVFEFLVLRPDRIKQQDLGDLKLGFFESKTAGDEYDLARRLMAGYLPVETVDDGTDANVGTITTVDFG